MLLGSVLLILKIPRGISCTGCVIVFNIVHIITNYGPVVLVNSIIVVVVVIHTFSVLSLQLKKLR